MLAPMTAFEQSLSSAVPDRTNWALAVSLKNDAGYTSSRVSGAGSSWRFSMWQNGPNCCTHCAVAADADAGALGSGLPRSAVLPAAFGFVRNLYPPKPAAPTRISATAATSILVPPTLPPLRLGPAPRGGLRGPVPPGPRPPGPPIGSPW